MTVTVERLPYHPEWGPMFGLPDEDSTPTRPSLRVRELREAHALLVKDYKAGSKRYAEAEKALTENDWKWVRGEWHH